MGLDYFKLYDPILGCVDSRTMLEFAYSCLFTLYYWIDQREVCIMLLPYWLPMGGAPLLRYKPLEICIAYPKVDHWLE